MDHSLVFSDAMRLHAMGFAIHWIREKSKAPVFAGWTKGERHTIAELSASYRPEYNLGVRLGEASKVNGGFLCVIDCDLKDPKYKEEFDRTVEDLVLSLSTLRVMSGRKNGSCHFYALTSEIKRKGFIAKSAQVIKPKMGKKNAIHAWTIELLAEGCQTVLPPSIHPQSGQSYDYATPFVSADQIKFLTPEILAKVQFSNEEKAPEGDAKTSFNFVDFDFSLEERISIDDIEMITEGTGSVDRSAEVFTLSMKMLRVGFTVDEIVSIFTDPTNYLAHCALERRKGSRQNAAQWVYDYNIKKALTETSKTDAFLEEYVEPKPLSTSETIEQAEKIEKEIPWKSKIDRAIGGADFGRPRNKLENVILFLLNGVVEGVNPLKWDKFSDSIFLAFDTPFGKKGEKFSDMMVISIKAWLSCTFRMAASNDLIFESVLLCAEKAAFHPVKDYLNALTWDKESRIESWLKDYLNAEGDKEYLKIIGTKILVAMVKRIFEPGCKFDHVIVLEGKQGSGKSSAVNILGGQWSCETFLDPTNKDTILYLAGAWAIEVAELSGMNKADQNHLKAFITKNFDRIRPPYGKVTKDIPRQCIFFGTTNDLNYLRDESGNRRYWPVKVGQTNFEALSQNRDQLFAEAKVLWELGEPIYITEEKTAILFGEEQKKRMALNDYEDDLAEWVCKKAKGVAKDTIDLNGFKTIELGGDSDAPLGLHRNVEKYFVTNALRRLGFEYRAKRRGQITQKLWSISASKIDEIVKSLDQISSIN